ncbi:MAG TPA: AAA family ATPase [Roseiarcus sp.]|jgi:predicted ATP-dependent endonuclease of OLD family
MLKSISLKFTEMQGTVTVPSEGVTIFVGPNNSGKSLVLRELEQDISSNLATATKLLSDFEITWPDEAKLYADITALSKNSPPNMSPDEVYVGRFNPSGILDSARVQRNILEAMTKQKLNKRFIASQFLRFFLIRLDGRTRFALTNDQVRGDLLDLAQNMLMHLFKDDDTRKRISEIVHDAFGVYLTIDPLSGQHLRIRLSQIKPDAEEQHWNNAAREFHAKAIYIKDASDGVQAFVGILCAVFSGDYRAILIDEPEAFLHPPLARKLGYELTSKLKEGGTLMASTHSSDFLMGCLQASPHVRVVRLVYSNGRSNGRIVDPAILANLFKAPLMRSANVISALFHDGVVVTESDNDRAFYAEIYYRLAEQEKGYPSDAVYKRAK